MLLVYYLTGSSQSQNSGSLLSWKKQMLSGFWTDPMSPYPSQPCPSKAHILLRCCSSIVSGHLASLSAGHAEVHGPLTQAVRPERHATSSLELCDAQGCTHTFFSSPLPFSCLFPLLYPCPWHLYLNLPSSHQPRLPLGYSRASHNHTQQCSNQLQPALPESPSQ